MCASKSWVIFLRSISRKLWASPAPGFVGTIWFDNGDDRLKDFEEQLQPPPRTPIVPPLAVLSP